MIPTHVHLDYAGGAGLLMQSLPRVTLLVHPRGARHMIDPSALYQGALAVYGQHAMDRDYGKLIPVPAERVQSSTGWFSGDTFGLSYREFDNAIGAWILPTSTPMQFEPEALCQLIGRLLSKQPRRMYLTHFGQVDEVDRLADLRLGDCQTWGVDSESRPQRGQFLPDLQPHSPAMKRKDGEKWIAAVDSQPTLPKPDRLLAKINAMVALGQQLCSTSSRHEALKAGLEALARAQLHRHGIENVDAGLAALALDLELNAQGLADWIDHQQRRLRAANKVEPSPFFHRHSH